MLVYNNNNNDNQEYSQCNAQRKFTYIQKYFKAQMRINIKEEIKFPNEKVQNKTSKIKQKYRLKI